MIDDLRWDDGGSSTSGTKSRFESGLHCTFTRICFNPQWTVRYVRLCLVFSLAECLSEMFRPGFVTTC
jgi:hypothetical protein